MRFHQLTVCAFGPFAGTETVDFDALSADGLFLLRGPTGSGKTSVLDALTFALYGDVPGERSRDRLKSQHAPAERVPYVELEFSSGEDRYWVRRQPAYYRPAKRAGAKAQREGTSLVIKRFQDAEWRPVPTARVAEGDLELQQIIGLKLHEFTTVIMLPQGAFAKLLHASNEERRGILEQLFDIGTYERLETHLWDQMRQAEAQLKDVESQLHAHAAGVRSAAASLLGSEAADLEQVDTDQLTAVVAERAQAQQRSLIDAAQAAQSAQRRTAEHAESLQQARTELTRWAQHLQRREQLQTQRSEVDAARDQIAEHTAAAGLQDWFTTAEEAEHAHHQAQQHAAEAVAGAQEALTAQSDVAVVELTTDGQTDASALQGAVTETVQLQARLSDHAAAEAEAQYTQLLADIQAAQEAADQAQTQLQELAAQLQTHQQRLQEHQERLIEPTDLQARRDAAHHALETARGQSALADQRDTLRSRLSQADAQITQRRHSADTAQDTYRTTAEAYLRWQAHELAEALAPGQPCLVCGSTDHPDPLTSSAETVTRSQVDAAAEAQRTAHADLEQAKAEQRSTAAGLEEVQNSLAEHRDTSTEDVRALQQQAEAELTAAQNAQAEQHRLRVEIDGLSAALAETRQQHSSAAHRAEQQSQEAARLSSEATTQHQRLTALRAGHSTIADRRQALTDLQTTLHTAQRAARTADTAADQAHRSRSAALQQLEKSVFGSVEQLHAALATEEELAVLRQRVGDFDQALQQLEFDAELDEVRAGSRRAQKEEQTPDQQSITTAAETAEAAQRASQEQDRQLTAFIAQSEALSASARALDDTLARQQEQTQELVRRAELAKTVNGRGENVLKMRLTTFVLAARLERIAEAATDHLEAMTNGRYQLLLDAERSGAGLRGLDLKVHDEYAEQQRPAESLSGGETFMTSLAMALGLAEVVQAEAGGIGMESLFIDEGFGSLDDHTLDAVMAALHTLQGEGRRIGVVSHVSEMHQQIPVQLRVEKARSGSTLHMDAPV